MEDLIKALEDQIGVCGECDPTGGYGSYCATCSHSRTVLQGYVGKRAWDALGPETKLEP